MIEIYFWLYLLLIAPAFGILFASLQGGALLFGVDATKQQRSLDRFIAGLACLIWPIGLIMIVGAFGWFGFWPRRYP